MLYLYIDITSECGHIDSRSGIRGTFHFTFTQPPCGNLHILWVYCIWRALICDGSSALMRSIHPLHGLRRSKLLQTESEQIPHCITRGFNGLPQCLLHLVTVSPVQEPDIHPAILLLGIIAVRWSRYAKQSH